MANNPQSSGAQPLRPPAVGSTGQPGFGPPFPVQFLPMISTQQGQPFVPASTASQQFRLVGQGVALPNVGMPSNQSQLPQFSQSIQQLPPRPAPPAHSMPSSQAIQIPYIQQGMPLTSSSMQPQQTALPITNMPSLGGPVTPLSSSYTFAPSSFGQPQNVSASPQFQPSQMHAPVAPGGGQPWLPSGIQGGPVVTPAQQTGQHPIDSSTFIPAVNAPSIAETSSFDWQEHTSEDGRKYYYNKKTRQSSWEKPLELITPMESRRQGDGDTERGVAGKYHREGDGLEERAATTCLLSSSHKNTAVTTPN